MDMLTEDQTLQAVLGRDLGIDNEALDFQQLEDYITSEDMCLPEEAQIPAVAYGTDPTGMNDLKLNVRLTSHLNPQPQSHPQSMYCSIPQTRFDLGHHHHQLYKHHPSLPDSPPDSGSEPYSPPDGNQHSMQDPKPHSMVPVTSVPGPMYQQGRPHLNMQGKGPPHGPPPGHIPGGYVHEPPKLNHLPQSQPPSSVQAHPSSHQITPPLNHHILNPHFGSMNNTQNPPTKKRKYPDSPNNTLTTSALNGINSIVSIKQEPPGAPPFPGYSIPDCSGDDDYSYDIDGNGSFMDSSYQVIKWQAFNQQKWSILTDGDLKDVPTISYRVDADKGFNFSVPDDAFVCQKKNHFQVTVHIGAHNGARYVRTSEGVKKIEHFFLHFHGVKVESVSQSIKIEQSQSDRSKKAFYPVKVDLNSDQVTKVTVGRLHFSETTSNNMRKKGKPNPDQRYFMLVVALHAHSGDNSYLVAASSSERIIVRASNPGQFDSDVDVLWSKGQTQDSVYHVGRVGVNTDHPDEALTIHGNIKLTGHLMSPSDIRAKENLEELNTKEALQKVQQLRLYKYQYSKDYAETAGIPTESRNDAGVIAQEMIEVLPDAVQETGDIVLPNGQHIENFLVVKKDRIFMENVGAVKELCKLTDNLENRIDELEYMNKKLAKLKRFDSLKSNLSLKSGSSISTVSSSVPPKRPHSHHRSDGKSRHKHSAPVTPPPSRIKSLCSNRFIQITIIILILIMAFCLVAITTLYILERQGSKTTSTGKTGHLEVTKGGKVSPAVSTQVSKHSNISSEETTNPPPHVTTKPKTTERAPPTSPTQPSLSTVTIPAYPVCESDCEEYCCSHPQEDDPHTHINNSTTDEYDFAEIAEVESGGSSTSEIRDDEMRVKIESEPNVVTNGRQAPTTTPPLNTFTIDIPNGSKFSPVVINGGDNGYNVINNDDKTIHHYYRRRRNTAADDLRPVIRIKQLNFTLGPEYCKTPGTCDGRNNTFLAYLSPTFGMSPVTLQFRLRTQATVAFCSYSEVGTCHHTSGADTDKTRGERVIYIADPENDFAEFNFTIGYPYSSTYKFKITTVESRSCELMTTESGMLYEYTLTFVRKPCKNSDIES